MSKPRYYIRTFLNHEHHHAGAHVIASVGRTRRRDSADTDANAVLDISDCYKTISLDFPLYSAKARTNSVHKARLLAEVLSEFAAALEEEARLAEQRKREHRS